MASSQTTAPTTPQTSITLSSLPKLSSGKVRDLYAVSPSTLLFVTTDRISAYDVVLGNGVPRKGAVLTLLSAYWFDLLRARVPGLQTHFLTLDTRAIPSLTGAERALLRGRCMQVRRLRIFPVEAIVRGYLAGSAWKEYAARGTVHGIALPAGLRRCDALPGGPLYTPSTKAEQGQHDENISPERAAALIGDARHAARVAELAVAVYAAAAARAAEAGLIIADTKFEFGLDEETGDVVLVDEVLTPDSSRFWAADRYEPGREQDSFDKQGLRDWLTAHGLQGKEGVVMPEEVVRATADRYEDVFRRLTGKTVDEALAEVPGGET